MKKFIPLILVLVFTLSSCQSKTLTCKECETENDIANLYCSGCASELVLEEEDEDKVKGERVDNRCDIILKYIEENKHKEALDLIEEIEKTVGTNDELRECKYQLGLVIDYHPDAYKLLSSLGNYKDAEEQAIERRYQSGIYFSEYDLYQTTAYEVFVELGDYKDSKQRAEKILAEMDAENVYELGFEAYMNLNFDSAEFFFKKCKKYEDAKQLLVNINLLKEAKGVYKMLDDEEHSLNYDAYIVYDGTDLVLYRFNDDLDFGVESNVVLGCNDESHVYFTTEKYYPEIPIYTEVFIEKKGKNVILTEYNSADGPKYKKTTEYTAKELEERYNEARANRFDDDLDSSSNNKSEPRIGMTADDVKASTWGSPLEINKTTYSWGVKEQWVYYGNKYIYLEDGIVTAIQE